MPGIVGLVTRQPRAHAEAQLGRMLAAVRHDPAAETGTFIDERHGVYLGWCARRADVAHGLPVTLERRDAVLMFSGRAHLIRNAADDPQFPATLNGRFHGCLLDRSTGTLTLFNDRYGMRRLYCHESPDASYFAAEAKAILAIHPHLREIGPRGLADMIVCGCVLEDRSLFRGIDVLPPASAWQLREGRVVTRGRYFETREWEEQAPLDSESFYEELRDTFERRLRSYFESETGVGMSLTGGLDTRMIMACHGASPGSLPCYTFGGTRRDSQDVLIARRVAAACGQPHQVIEVGTAFLSAFAGYAERAIFFTDGCAHARHAVDLYANERAAEIAPVRMTGNYGSEVLRQVPAFKPVKPAQELFDPELLAQAQESRAVYDKSRLGSPLSFAVFRQAPWHHHGLLALEETQIDIRSPYLDNDVVRTMFRAPTGDAGSDVCLRLIADARPALARIRTDRGLTADRTVASTLARWRSEASFKAEYASDYGMPHWLARTDALLPALHFDRLWLGRHKFAHFRRWYRDELAPYVQDVLLDPRSRTRPYVSSGAVERVVRRHLQGTHNYTTEIHTLLTLELTHRLFVDRSGQYGGHG